MTFGMQTWNDSSILNIDESLKTYVYMAKYPIPDRIASHVTIDITCVGVPLIYFGIPWGRTDRAGVAMTGLVSIGSNLWRVSLTVINPSGANLGLFLRVFGRLDLNYPNGSGQMWGMQLFDGSGKIIFDSGLRLQRLAGNTYDTELTLTPNCPTGGQPANAYDSSYSMPFSMQNKSIMANARGIVYWLEYWGSYNDVDNIRVDQYQKRAFESVFFSSGQQLTIGRAFSDFQMVEYTNPVLNDLSNFQTVFSRLAVIDNALYP